MRLGVFGGTFDPIHNAHLTVAESAAAELGLEMVLFIPAGQPYLKSGQEVSSSHHRIAMVELAVQAVPKFKVSDMEVRRPGPSYTIDTLEELDHRTVGEVQIFLIMGFDSLMEVFRWKEPRKIFEKATLAAYPRLGTKELNMELLETIVPGASERVLVIQAPKLEISGTKLRRRIREGLAVDQQMPDGVVGYIQEHGLYR